MKKNKLFSFRKKNTRGEKDNDVIIIPTYSLNATITPARYRGGEVLDRFAEDFEPECMDFISKAEKMDSDNGAYMDQTIESKENEAFKELDKEHSEHRRLILLPLDDMHTGDKVFSEEGLKMAEDELVKKKELLKFYKRICYKGTACEEMMGGKEDEE